MKACVIGIYLFTFIPLWSMAVDPDRYSLQDIPSLLKFPQAERRDRLQEKLSLLFRHTGDIELGDEYQPDGSRHSALNHQLNRLAYTYPSGVKVWDFATGKQCFGLAQQMGVHSLAVSDIHVAVGLYDRSADTDRQYRADVYSLQSGRKLCELPGYSNSCTFGLDGRRLLMLSISKAQVWETVTGKMVQEVDVATCQNESLSPWLIRGHFNSDGTRLVLFFNKRLEAEKRQDFVSIFDVDSGQEIFHSRTEEASLSRFAAFLSDDATKFINLRRSKARWELDHIDVDNGSASYIQIPGPTDPINREWDCSHDGSKFVLCDNRSLKIYSTITGKLLHCVLLENFPDKLVFSPDDTQLYIVYFNDCEVRPVDMPEHVTTTYSFQDSAFFCNRVTFSSAGNLVCLSHGFGCNHRAGRVSTDYKLLLPVRDFRVVDYIALKWLKDNKDMLVGCGWQRVCMYNKTKEECMSMIFKVLKTASTVAKREIIRHLDIYDIMRMNLPLPVLRLRTDQLQLEIQDPPRDSVLHIAALYRLHRLFNYFFYRHPHLLIQKNGVGYTPLDYLVASDHAMLRQIILNCPDPRTVFKPSSCADQSSSLLHQLVGLVSNWVARLAN